MPLDHCDHCRGFDATCGCTHGCPRPSHSQCKPRGHCEHCRGLAAPCGCSYRCPVPPGAECKAREHCSHCRGLDAPCGCRYGCGRGAGVRCRSGGELTPSIGLKAYRINLVLVIDHSGSMCGDKWRTVQRGVVEAIEALTDEDFITIMAFNGTVTPLGGCRKRSFDVSEFLALRAEGGTALYDAMAGALVGGFKAHVALQASDPLDVKTYVVVMTDGEDGDSTAATLDDVKELVLKVNKIRDFVILFAGVELTDKGRRPMLELAMLGDDDVKYTDLHAGTFAGFFTHITMTLRLMQGRS